MSPSEDDADRHIMPGPPWVRQGRPRGDTYRQTERGLSEPGPMGGSFRPPPRRVRPQYRDVDERDEVSRGRLSGPDGGYHDSWPPALDPVVMPPPPLEKSRLPGLGIVFKFGGAVSVAACAALAMMNAVQVPATGIVASVESGSQSAGSPVFGGLTEIASAQAKALAAPEPPQAVDAVAAAAPPNAVAAAQPSAVLPRASLGETPLRGTLPREASLEDAPLRQAPERRAFPGEAQPRPDPVTRAAPAPEERRPVAVAPMSRDEMNSLLKRGRALIAAGDIASARLILTRVAEAGSVDACLALAGTFDAAELAELHVLGVQPDSAKARAWYLKAAEQGSAEAKRRLQQSSVR